MLLGIDADRLSSASPPLEAEIDHDTVVADLLVLSTPDPSSSFEVDLRRSPRGDRGPASPT
jgi:hypothetical protein